MDVVHIKPVELDKDKTDVQPSNLKCCFWSVQGNKSKPLITDRIEPPLSFLSILQPQLGWKTQEKILLLRPCQLFCWQFKTQLTQSENKLCDKIMAMKFYFMDKLQITCAEIVRNCPAFVDMRVSEHLRKKERFLKRNINCFNAVA